jgi:hypothetical protein
MRKVSLTVGTLVLLGIIFSFIAASSVSATRAVADGTITYARPGGVPTKGGRRGESPTSMPSPRAAWPSFSESATAK